MTVGMLLLGALSLALAFYWHKRILRVQDFIHQLSNEVHEDIDLSGKKKYTNCGSYKWVMKNVVYGDYMQSGETLRNIMMNRTLVGTMILSMFLGVIPVMIVFILFQSFNLIGPSLILIFVAIYELRGPGSLDVTTKLLKWQMEQKEGDLSTGDLAYARVSEASLRSWRKILAIMGVLSIALSPIAEGIPVAFIYLLTSFIGFSYNFIYLPIASYSLGLAFILFIIIGPAILVIAIIGIRMLWVRRDQKDEGLLI